VGRRGARVRVSVVCAVSPKEKSQNPPELILNGHSVRNINPDLSSGPNVTLARRLLENADVAFQGVKLTGPFDITEAEARSMLQQPPNPDGSMNSDVIRRLFDIDDILGRDSDRWVVDFGTGLSERDAALYESPFAIVQSRAVPFRDDPSKSRSTEARLRERCWEFQRPRPQLRQAVSGLERFIVTPESSEHRIFVFVPKRVLIQGSLFAIARDDYATFGILNSKIHEYWASAQGNRRGVGNQRRYNIGVSFETFPFPTGLYPNVPAKEYADHPSAKLIATAAMRLEKLRSNWLNPPNLIDIVPESVPDLPHRVVPKNKDALAELNKRTLTSLYNQRPQWLQDAHRDLDEAVAAAYGWSTDILVEEALSKLLNLNLSRSGTTDVDNLVESVDDEDD
jgi:hypothetical protein